jgi:predicted DNA-binding transcriptional regulator YafY
MQKFQFIRYQILDRCFRNKNRRFYIDDLIQTISLAMEEFGPKSGVSRKTIFNDINAMKSLYLIELDNSCIDGKKKYYRYLDTEFSIENQPISSIEKEYFRDTIQVLNRIKGINQFEWVKDVIPRFTESKDVEKEIISYQSNEFLRGVEYLNEFYLAIISKAVLKIEYKDFKSQEPYSIIFHPSYLKQYNNRWFAFGLNEVKNIETWTIALDRIISIVSHPNKYIDSKIDWTDYFEDLIGVTKPVEAISIKLGLSVKIESSPYFETKPFHPSQKLLKKLDEEVHYEFDIIVNHELISNLLSFGSQLKVIYPKEVKDTFFEEIQKMYKLY